MTRRARRFGGFAVMLACALFAMSGGARADDTAGAAILEQLREFRQMGTVLHIAAHPDDENTWLIAYLARGRHYRTGYLSLTRGDGGQNVIGPEFGAELGVIRTHELLAARAVDGGVQFFTRARDFGFSKDYQQTLTRWDREQVVSDMVRVIREFRPDVMITRFSPQPSTTHGHHTASAVLAIEAFQKAGDPKAFPQQNLPPWQPRRLLMNVGGPNAATSGPTLQMDIGGVDARTGKSFGELATVSRSMHKSQGFGNIGNLGGAGPRLETFQLLAGAPAEKDIMDGVDLSWNRWAGGAEMATRVDQIIAGFDAKNPAASLQPLLEVHRWLASAKGDERLLAEKRRLLDRIVAACIGLQVASTVEPSDAVPGQRVRVTVGVKSATPVRWMGVQLREGGALLGPPTTVQGAASAHHEVTIPAGAAVSQPYWLEAEGTAGMFAVRDVSLIGMADNPPVLQTENVFEIQGQTLVLDSVPSASSGRGLTVIAPVSLAFEGRVELFAPSSKRPVKVVVTAARAPSRGTVRLQAPAGWTVTPASRPFSLDKIGASAAVEFTVTAPLKPATANLHAMAEVDGRAYDNARAEIRYAHIPPLLLQPPTHMRAVCLDLAISGKRVGYLPGAGDSIGDALAQMGYDVVTLSGDGLTAEKLRSLDAVVIGVRAFNVRTDLGPHMSELFRYVENGGTVVAQYNTPKGLQTPQLAPYKLALSDNLPRNRVTDEHAKVTFLAPDHPALNHPNKITAADFDGWVQERGLNFPAEWDSEHFTALLACSDPGEPPLKSGLLVARYGKGYFVYTGLSFFRQLPAGVPGAWRLFANLVSLGK